MQRVFVIDQNKSPLMPCTSARARWLLAHHRAAVYKRYPFIIRLKDSKSGVMVTPLRLKLDPGSHTTGMGVVNEATGEVGWAGELTHRGNEVHQALTSRLGVRRSRRQRHTRYREARFNNRGRPAGWLPPSLQSRVRTIVTWTDRLTRWCPIGALSFEAVRFDTQLLQDPDVAGVEYQHGTLTGIELREYLLLKWAYRCTYCHQPATATNRWEIDHIVPRSRGGSDRVSNLALSCHRCNCAKGDQTAEEFGHPNVQQQAKMPLNDAAAVNCTRREVQHRLLAFGMPVEMGSGGLTKWNRTQRRLPKTHWLDAATVGASTPPRWRWRSVIPLLITAQGWQRRQMCLVNTCGFPRTKAKGASRAFAFETGDIVKAIVPSGKPHGTHVGRVAIKASGNFTITTRQRVVPDVPHRFCSIAQRGDGFSYQKGERAFLPIP